VEPLYRRSRPPRSRKSNSRSYNPCRVPRRKDSTIATTSSYVTANERVGKELKRKKKKKEKAANRRRARLPWRGESRGRGVPSAVVRVSRRRSPDNASGDAYRANVPYSTFSVSIARVVIVRRHRRRRRRGTASSGARHEESPVTHQARPRSPPRSSCPRSTSRPKSWRIRRRSVDVRGSVRACVRVRKERERGNKFTRDGSRGASCRDGRRGRREGGGRGG